MNDRMRLLIGASALMASAAAMAQVTFYEGEGFRGRAFSTTRPLQDFNRSGFNDRASSVIVDRGRWEVCEDSRFRGRCVVLRPGSYDSLSRMGIDDRLSSARPVRGQGRYADESPEPLAAPNYEYRRRPEERVYDAEVTSVHAVMGQPEQRCWIDREQVAGRGGPSVAGGVIGGIIGGVLGHQIGHGTGKDVATVGGAVAGAAIGANAGRDRNGNYDRDVRRCDTAQNGTPDYWDVNYEFRDVEHRIQMSAPPGRTILVNRDGEPRQ